MFQFHFSFSCTLSLLDSVVITFIFLWITQKFQWVCAGEVPSLLCCNSDICSSSTLLFVSLTTVHWMHWEVNPKLLSYFQDNVHGIRKAPKTTHLVRKCHSTAFNKMNQAEGGFRMHFCSLNVLTNTRLVACPQGFISCYYTDIFEKLLTATTKSTQCDDGLNGPQLLEYLHL